MVLRIDGVENKLIGTLVFKGAVGRQLTKVARGVAVVIMAFQGVRAIMVAQAQIRHYRCDNDQTSEPDQDRFKPGTHIPKMDKRDNGTALLLLYYNITYLYRLTVQNQEKSCVLIRFKGCRLRCTHDH